MPAPTESTEVVSSSTSEQQALFSACVFGRVSEVAMLLGSGVPVSKRNEKGESALDLAWNETLATTLVEHGALLESDDGGKSVFEKFIKSGVPSLNRRDVIRTLFRNGAEVDFQNNTLVVRLLACLLREDAEILLACGVDIDTRDSRGHTALFFAASHRWVDSVDMLLALGADINASSYNEQKPVEAATVLGYTDCVKALVRRGARVQTSHDEDMMSMRLESMCIEERTDPTLSAQWREQYEGALTNALVSAHPNMLEPLSDLISEYV